MVDVAKIRELAYKKWEQAGYPPGDGVNFYLEAEQELRGQAKDKPAKKKIAAKAEGQAKDKPAKKKIAAKASAGNVPPKSDRR